MNFEQFMKVIKKQVPDMIWLDKVDASISEFKKNNGVVLHGLCIKKKENNYVRLFISKIILEIIRMAKQWKRFLKIFIMNIIQKKKN